MSLTRAEYQLFQKYIALKCGIELDDSKAYLVESRLAKLLIDSGLDDFSQLFDIVERKSDANIEIKIIDAITTNETYWFRDSKSWEFIKCHWLPKMIFELKQGTRKKVRIWSSAVSTGQEIYSLVITICEYLSGNKIKGVTIDNFEFVGTDISTNVLAIARHGRYDPISIMRGLNPEIRDKYFEQTERYWTLKEMYRKKVHFEQFNLQNSFILMGKFDLIFCRYVLIYFTDDLRNKIFDEMTFALNPEGVLLIGASEIYYPMDQYFDKNITEYGTYFVARRG